MNDLYAPEAYFGRLDALFVDAKLDMGRGRARYWRRHPWELVKTQSLFFAQAIGLFARLMRGLPDPALRREYHRRIWRVLKVRRDPGVLLFYVLKCAMHYHAYSMARQMASGQGRIVNSF